MVFTLSADDGHADVCSSYLGLLLNLKTSSTKIYPDYLEFCFQRTLWLWLLISALFVEDKMVHTGPFAVPVGRNDDDDCLIRVCSNQRLFLVNTNFHHENRYGLAQRPPSHSKCCIQANHVSSGHRSFGSVKDCQSF